MALELKQTLKLSQQLVITPQLRQAIKLLQLSHLDLVDTVKQELLENPALEEIPGTQSVETNDAEQALRERTKDVQSDEVDQNNGAQNSDQDWLRILESYKSGPPRSSSSGGTIYDDLPPIEANLQSTLSLTNHLEWQLGLLYCTDAEHLAAIRIINNLDEHGFLSMSLEELAERAGVDLDDAEGAQMIVQGLDPQGCGSLNVVECLVLQAKITYPEDPTFVLILRDHMHNLEKRNYQGIAKDLDLHLEDVIEYHKMIRGFEPWPGRGYSDAEPQYITPDVYVVKVGDEWQIMQNDDGLPKLRISNYYEKVLAGAGSKEDRKYIKEKLEAADFLIKSIYKRQSTIHKVVASILRRQQDFFEHGVDHLRPMVLRDVADDVEVHESTVSRVTSNKYIQCPHGILELKFFFTAGVQQAGNGEDLSARKIKNRIKQLISAENPKKPLSDQGIVKALADQNIQCARRTVAKYREAMGFLASSKRKQLF
jgi:RNA polymerase sigma-54 factor